MKIVVIGPTYPFRGGISHYTTLLCEHLRKRHSVQLISFKRQYPAWLFPGKTQLDPSLVKITTDGEPILDPLNPLSWRRVIKALQTSAPGLVIFQWWNPFFAVPYFFISRRIQPRISGKVLFECHNVIPHETSPVDSFLIRMAFSAVDHFIVHSEADKTHLLEVKPGSCVTRVPLPTWDIFSRSGELYRDKVVTYLDKLASEVRVESPHPYHPSITPSSEGCKNLLFFGNIRPYKGLTYLLEALPIVLKEVPVRLWVVGEFYHGEIAYRQQISDLGIGDHIRLINRYIPNEEVENYFNLADLVVLPYTSATQSAVAQVAYSFDKPIVATAVGGLLEVVKDGITGFVVPPQNSLALAQAIIQYFKENRAQEFARQIRVGKSRFSWDRLIQEIEALM